MTLKYKRNGTLEVQMDSHIEDLIDSCPHMDANPGCVGTPATKNLFNIDDKSKLLDKDQREIFHSCVAKGLFIGKRACPNVAMPISVLSERVTKLTVSDQQ